MPVDFPTQLRHEVVRASAGAGKTYQLTTRYLQLISAGEQPQHVLATTFTRKAAGEVLARVLGRLARACVDKDERQQLADALEIKKLKPAACVATLRTLTDALGRLSVGTIDGFFNRAARAMAFELGVPPDPRMIDEGSPLAKQLRADAIHAVLGEQADREGGMHTLIEMLRRLHHDMAQRSVTDVIDAIVSQLNDGYRAYPDRALWDTLPTAGLLNDDLLSTALHGLEVMADSLPVNKGGNIYKGFSDRYQALLADAYARRWDAVLANGLVKKIVDGEQTYSSAPITDDWHAAIRPFIAHASAVEIQAVAEQTLATYDLLELFDRQYQALRWSHRVLLFSDLTHLLADGLPGMGAAGVEELCYRLDARVTHLLLDEFQDTSLRQWEVLRPFAEQIVATGDDTRSLFCVGDTKQAIYGWRGGCAELFDEVQQLPGVESRTLSKSWRSSPVVLDCVNRVFNALVGNPALEGCERAAADWQAGFEDHAAIKDDLPGHVVLHTTLPKETAGASSDTGEDEDDAGPPDAHAHYTAGYIQRLCAAHRGQSIGVLMRSRASAKQLMFALRAHGVHAAEEGGNPIDHTPAVSAVLSAIQLADHPGDTVARFHVANSPVGSLVGIQAGDDNAQVEAAARRLRRALLDHGYAALLTGWTRALAPSCDDKSLRRLMQLVEIAERYDAEDAGLRPGFFVQAARAERVDDPSPARVRVMTIHAAKGLEFDAVVLPDLDKMLSGMDKTSLLVLHRDSPIAPVRGVYRWQKAQRAALLPELQEAHDQQAYEKRIEDLCLLYVAMTRARQALHLLVRPLTQGKSSGKPNGKPTSSGLTNLSYAAILRQSLRENDDEGFDGDEVLFESGSTAWSPAEAVSEDPPDESAAPPAPAAPIHLAKPASRHGRSWVPTTPSQMHHAGSVDVKDLLRLSPGGGRAFGTLVHALFERVGFIEEGVPGDDELAQAIAATPHEGIDPGEALGVLHRALGVPEIQSLLGRYGATALWRERPFVVRLGNRLVRGTFDRVHLWEKAGQPTKAHLIDFKTDRVDDTTIQAVASDYAEQLQLYRAAIGSITGLDVSEIRASLCFVGDGRVVEID